jgi:Ca2+-binding EF-hand superfamily protein
MTSQAWKIAGLVLALSGSVAMAQTESETNAPPKRKGPKPDPEMQGTRPGREEVLKRFDADGDGTLNEAERQAMDAAMLKHRGRPGGPQGNRPSREEIMKRFDTDGDGELSESEREAMRAERERIREENSKRFDADGDGQLSKEERKTMHETLRDERPEPPPEEGGDI